MALGIASLTVEEQATTFATLANDGEYVTPHVIAQITENDGTTVTIPLKITRRQVLSPQAAADVDYALSFDTCPGGTAFPNGVLNPGRPTIGKTGTTDNEQSAFFIGAIPQYSLGVGDVHQRAERQPRGQSLDILPSVNGQRGRYRRQLAGDDLAHLHARTSSPACRSSRCRRRTTPASPCGTRSAAPEAQAPSPSRTPHPAPQPVPARRHRSPVLAPARRPGRPDPSPTAHPSPGRRACGPGAIRRATASCRAAALAAARPGEDRRRGAAARPAGWRGATRRAVGPQFPDARGRPAAAAHSAIAPALREPADVGWPGRASRR